MRNITLHCPICGNDQFLSFNENTDISIDLPEDDLIKCSDCGCMLTKDELIEDNQALINANLEDIEEQIVLEIKNSLKKCLKSRI